ncbi:MAG: hypothetical protein LH615_06465 [Ferruginibacter sp.]|nr:hypothetical protein [Ferruginibacter sp.]
MKNVVIILVIVFTATSLYAQNPCVVKHVEAYQYFVTPGINQSSIDINGNTVENKTVKQSNISIYLISNCEQTPVVISSSLGKIKMKLEFLRIKLNMEEAGTDEQGNLKIIKAPKNTFLWKANYVTDSETSYAAKERIIIKGTIGRRKFITSALSPKGLQPVAMY